MERLHHGKMTSTAKDLQCEFPLPQMPEPA
jgi:hypothetical protein